MPTATDLCGLGMSPFLASVIGNDPQTVTCAGTTLGTAAAIRSHIPELVAAGGATGAVLPSTAKVGTPYYIYCSSSTSAVIYVPSGQFLNTVQNDTFTLAQKKSVIMIQYKLNNWSTNLTA